MFDIACLRQMLIMARKTDPELERYTRELWETALQLVHGFRSAMSVPEEMELTFPQTMLLLELRGTGGCSMGELARHLRVTQGVATRMVDRLVDKGLVERKRDVADRRVVLVAPTAEGEAIARHIEVVNRGKIMRLLAEVPEKERGDQLAFLKGMLRQLEKEEAARLDHDGEGPRDGYPR